MPRLIFKSRAYQFATDPEIGGDDRIVGKPRRQFPEYPLGIKRLSRIHGAIFQRLPPALKPFFDPTTPGGFLLLRQHRQQRPHRRGAVADHIDFHRVAEAQPAAVDIYLNPPRISRLGQEFAIGKRRADHQEGVAAFHQIPARLRAEQPDRARHERQIVRQRGFSEQRLGHARLQALRDRDDLVGGFKRARSNQHGDFAAFVQNVSGRPEQALFRQFRGAGVTDTGMGRPVGERRILVIELLQVVRQNDTRDRALVMRDAHGAVDQVTDLLGHAGHPDIFGDILKKVLQVDFLLVTGAKAASRLLADQSYHGHMIHLGIIEPVQKVNRAGP